MLHPRFGNSPPPPTTCWIEVPMLVASLLALLAAAGPPSPFVIREMGSEDLGAAANVLADSFPGTDGGGGGGGGRGWLSRKVERVNSYLALRSRHETFRYADRTGSLRSALVACQTSDGRVVGVCEVDDSAPPGDEIAPAPRPYVANLAVDADCRRMGLATALLEEVEEIVRGWGGGRRERLHLRVREDNVAAREMYVRNGYEEIIDGADGSAPSSPRGEGRGILLMGKEL